MLINPYNAFRVQDEPHGFQEPGRMVTSGRLSGRKPDRIGLMMSQDGISRMELDTHRNVQASDRKLLIQDELSVEDTAYDSRGKQCAFPFLFLLY